LHVLSQLGLPFPEILWDTWGCEKLLRLGKDRVKARKDTEEGEAIEQEQKAKEEAISRLSLVNVCQSYDVQHRYSDSKERLQESFLTHEAEQAFTKEQVDYAAEDAIAAAKLYLPQVNAAALKGALHHLVTVEMPWTMTNARIEWTGIKVDAEQAPRLKDACGAHAVELLANIRDEYAIDNPNSHQQLKRFFEPLGLLDCFRKTNGRYSFDRKQLNKNVGKHPVIPLLMAYRRIKDIEGTELLNPAFVGVDGRVHPGHVQLGTDTGRQSCKAPNILGLEGALRPLIVPEVGYGIGEVDLSQIEVGIAGAEYCCQSLVDMFNSGDVYSVMAQRFYRAQLSDEDQQLLGDEFKRTHKDMRNTMKACTLGIIYGQHAHGLAESLGVQESKAQKLLDDFMGMFPDLNDAIAFRVGTSLVRGYASTRTGVRRYLPEESVGNNRNWVRNHPVQAGAAVVFKAAGIRLDRLYRRYGAMIIVPFHDAYVFEAPLNHLEEVAELTERVMTETVQAYYPELRPKAEVNIKHPNCWNKDGDFQSLDRWMAKPEELG
jgi:DNA polymerase-1